MEGGWYGPRQEDPVERIIAGLWLVALFVALISWAMLGGEMIRNEASPWVWTEYAKDLHRFGAADARFDIVLYAVFYLSAAFIPYSALRALFWGMYLNVNDERWVPSRKVLRTSAWLMASGGGILFVLLLESEVAFLQHFPSPESRLFGWTLTAAAIIAIWLIAEGIRSLRAELRRLRVTLPADAYLISHCARCGHTWSSPVAEAEQRHLRMHQTEHTAGGYPIE